MQIYGIVYRCSRRWAASPIWCENFEQKGAAYTPVFTVHFYHYYPNRKILTQMKYWFIALSNDPDKNYRIFYCSAAICFPHIEMVVFSDQEFINRWKAGLWNKIYVKSILKGSFLCVKTFQPITTVVNKDNKSFQCSYVPHIGFLWYLDSGEILLKGK